MKQRVITAVVLLALLAVVVWQIYTPLFIIVIAFLSAVAANEIMKCAKVSNKFIVILGTAVGAVIPFTSSENIMQPWISAEKWSHFISIVPPLAFAVIVIIAFFLAMIFDYEHTKFEDVAVSIVASIAVPYGFSMFGMLRDMYDYKAQLGVYLIFYGLITALGTDTGAQLGVPDMRIPIQYALTYPERVPSPVGELSLADYGKLTFFEPDYETFKCINVCKDAIEKGGLYPAAAIGANEESVKLFLNGKIKFTDIAYLNNEAMLKADSKSDFTLEDVLEADRKARDYVLECVK